MTERHRRVLSELAEMGLAQARKLHDAAMAAEAPETAAELSAAFHRISRSVRQSLALEARLEREQRLGGYRERKAALDEALERGRRRQIELRQRVKHMIWTEAERPEAERLERRLLDGLTNASFFEGFADEPIDVHIARIRRDLGLDKSLAHPGRNGEPDFPSIPGSGAHPGRAWTPAGAGASAGLDSG